MYVTVFGGDEQVEQDEESLRTWQSLGVPIELTTDDNWWSNGPTGPCGPDSEIFLWTGKGSPEGTPTTDDRWVEVWNHVMMRYRRLDDGSIEPLQQRNIDTGLGLERLTMLLEGKNSVYETELFEPWMRIIPELWKLDEEDERIVIDHLRSSMVIIGDGVHPSNTGRGYVLRRLIRRVLTLLWRSRRQPRTLSDLPMELFEHTSRTLPPGRAAHAGPPDADRRGDPVLQPARARPQDPQPRAVPEDPRRDATSSTCTRPTACRGSWSYRWCT